MKKANMSNHNNSKTPSLILSKIENKASQRDDQENDKTEIQNQSLFTEIANLDIGIKKSLNSEQHVNEKNEFNFQEIKCESDNYVSDNPVPSDKKNEIIKFENIKKSISKENHVVPSNDNQNLTQYLQMDIQQVKNHFIDKNQIKENQKKNSTLLETDQTNEDENDDDLQSEDTEDEEESDDNNNSKKEVEIGTSMSINKKNIELDSEEKNSEGMLKEFYWKTYLDIGPYVEINYVTGSLN